jgi:pyruvate dehydrogenase E1 component
VPEGAPDWSLIGDSEFREGSLLECQPDDAERQLGNVTWIIDYNRQNLDGTRIPNQRGLHGADCDRIEQTAVARLGVVQLRHGWFREVLRARWRRAAGGFTDHYHTAVGSATRQMRGGDRPRQGCGR